MSKVYVAGKITGNPNYTKEFKDAETKLKAQGHIVMNPSIMPEGFEQTAYHHVCMAMIDVCDVVCFMPSWIDSKGSHLEMGYARGLRKEIKFL